MKNIFLISALVFLCILGSVIASEDEQENCGAVPKRRPSDCCRDVQRYLKDEYINECSANCADDKCCQANCLAKYLRILKDGEFDHETALESISQSFEGDDEWIKIGQTAVNTCVEKETSLRFLPGLSCELSLNTKMTLCLQTEIYSNCPQNSSDSECDDTRSFLKCINARI